MNARDKRIERAQTRVIFTVPFFAPGVARLPVVWDDTIPTACTAGDVIRFSPQFADKLSDSQLVTILCHETAHCLLGHIWRAPEGADWEVWNQACDHAVNLMLKDFAEMRKGKGFADPFPFPEPADAYCANPAFKGLAEEVIYGRLQQPKQPGCSGGAQGGLGGAKTPGASKSPQGGQPASGKPQPGGKPAPGSMPSFGQMTQPSKAPGQQPAQKKLGSDWANTMIQSAKVAEGQGSLPANLARLVGDLTHPKVPWYELLRSWLREQASDDWDFLTAALEYEPSGLILPSLKSEKCGPVVFATDTSGSIDQEMLSQFQTEKQNCLDTMRPKRLVDIYCDAAINAVDEYVPGETVTRKCPGGGGTDFRPVFEHIAGMAEPVKLVVYLTDLYGSFPDIDPGIPVLWVTWTKDLQAPFGQTVYAGA